MKKVGRKSSLELDVTRDPHVRELHASRKVPRFEAIDDRPSFYRNFVSRFFYQGVSLDHLRRHRHLELNRVAALPGSPNLQIGRRIHGQLLFLAVDLQGGLRAPTRNSQLQREGIGPHTP